MPSFNQRSKDNLSTCHTVLQKLFNDVILEIDCSVICGHRGEMEQNNAYESGMSKVAFPHGKHNSIPSLAVDVYPYPYDWEAGGWKFNDVFAEGNLDKMRRAINNIKKFYFFAGRVKEKAELLCMKIRWGGDWDSDNDLTDQNFNDLPHWEVII